MNKKNFKKVLAVLLSVSITIGNVTSVAAKEITGDTPEKVEIIQEDSTLNKKEEDNILPIGGVMPAEQIGLPDGETEELLEEQTITEENISCELKEQESVQESISGSYGYKTLNSTQKKVYNLFLAKMQECDKSSKDATWVGATKSGNKYAFELVDVSKYKLNYKQMCQVYYALEADHLEYFWLDDTTITETSGYVSKWYLMVEADYAKYAARKAAKNNIKKGTQDFFTAIDNAKAKGMSVIELELLIHDMIIDKVDYAYNSQNQPQKATYAHSIVGVFDDNSATDVVCEGYAKAFQYLCNYAGIESIYAVGYSTSSYGFGFFTSQGGHAWNLVKIGGQWTNVDLTWDDVNQQEMYDGIRYDYFNLPTKEFNEGKAHDYREDIFPGMYSVPNAATTEYSYYNYYHLNLNTKDLQDSAALAACLKSALEKVEERNDSMLRFKVDLATNYLVKIQGIQIWEEALATLGSNGIMYTLSGAKTPQTSGVMQLVVDRIYVENMCNGVVFGNSNYTAKVKKQTGRTVTDITNQCNLIWGNQNLTVYYDGAKLGSYVYEEANPLVSCPAKVEYNGQGVCPKVTVKIENNTLTEKKDYYVSYDNNHKIGTGTVTVTGMNGYAGVLTKKFQITAKQIKNTSIKLDKTQMVYIGKVIKPGVLVTDGKITLEEGVDYTLSYKNNKKMGKASVVMKGMGNYTGSVTKYFYVVPKKVTGLKVTQKTKSSGTITYKKQSGVKGYQIELYKGSKKVRTVNSTKTTVKIKTLKKNTLYKVRVRAYIKVGKTKKYGAYSKKVSLKTKKS